MRMDNTTSTENQGLFTVIQPALEQAPGFKMHVMAGPAMDTAACGIEPCGLSGSRSGLIAALIAGFGQIIAEVGCFMMVGGNILGYTRNIPMATALKAIRGEFAQVIALGECC